MLLILIVLELNIFQNKLKYLLSLQIEKNYVFKSIVIRNIFRMQGNYSKTCGYFCIGLIDFMLSRKT